MVLGWLLALVLALAVPASPREPAPPETVPVTANEFLPDRDLDDCVSSLPQPDCGSEGHAGWRQGLILVAILAGLAFIAWRIVRAARRQRRITHDA